MTLRRYRIEWYHLDGSTGASEQSAADATDAIALFSHNVATGSVFGYRPGANFRVFALADDACGECIGRGTAARGAACGLCNGTGVRAKVE